MTPLTKATIIASGFVLSEPLPNDWEKMSEEELNQYLEEHVWEPLENQDEVSLWEQIETLAHTFLQIANGEIKLK